VNKTPIRAAAAALALALAASACGSSSKTTGAAPSSNSTTAPSSKSATAPKQIVIGTAYAGSGAFSTSSLPELAGLQYWVNQENKKGGVFVGPFNKRIPVKLVSLNDQSSASTAAVLYDQLIAADHVNILVSDFGSVLTAPAVTIAQEHKVVLFDQTGTGTPFFTPGNPYIVLCDLPTSAIWPDPLVHFLIAKHIDKVAIVYDANDFDASQAATIKSGLAKAGVMPLVYEAVPTSTTSYGTIISTVAAKKPEAFLELGYDTNDIPFLQNLQSSGDHFDMVFTVFPGQLPALFEKNVPASALQYTFTYGTPLQLPPKPVNEGQTLSSFLSSITGGHPSNASFLDIAGYNTGLVIQAALAHATSFTQLGIRAGATAASGTLRTLEGNFVLNAEGAQVGELLPVAQLLPTSSGTAVKLVYPPSEATATAHYPAP